MSAPAAASPEPLFTPRFAGMWVFSFVTFFSAFQLLPAVPFRILELGGNTAQAGLFLFFYTLMSALAAPITGTVADHFGRRRTLIVASLVFIVFSILYGVIRDLRLLYLVAAVHGAIWSSILASSSAIMSEFIPESRRTQGIAMWGLASMSAFALAPPVGLFVFKFGWLTLCGELAVLSLLMAIAGWLLPVRDAARPSSAPNLSDAWDFRVMSTTVSLAVTAFGYGGITSYVALFSLERHIHPESLFFTASAATIALVRIFTSHLGDRLGPKAILYPALLCIPVAFAVLATAHSRTQLVASAVLFGAGFGSMYPAFATFILAHTDPERRARTFGSIVGAFDTGIAIGSFSIGTIGQHWSLGRAFGVAAAISCLAIPIFMLTSKRLIAEAASGTPVASPAEHV
ncbi:MAG TPA: MFS transporter [Thermoanaerobaculia bacterium]|nr:MFS transporter [Thermoanaerobaculia bacterium]